MIENIRNSLKFIIFFNIFFVSNLFTMSSNFNKESLILGQVERFKRQEARKCKDGELFNPDLKFGDLQAVIVHKDSEKPLDIENFYVKEEIKQFVCQIFSCLEHRVGKPEIGAKFCLSERNRELKEENAKKLWESHLEVMKKLWESHSRSKKVFSARLLEERKVKKIEEDATKKVVYAPRSPVDSCFGGGIYSDDFM